MLYLVAWLIVRQVVIVTAFIEGFLVHGFGIVKALSVWWCFWKPFVDGIWDRWWVIGFLVHMQWEVTFLMDSVWRSAGQAWRLENLWWFYLLLSLSLSHFHRISCTVLFWSSHFLLVFCHIYIYIYIYIHNCCTICELPLGPVYLGPFSRLSSKIFQNGCLYSVGMHGVCSNFGQHHWVFKSRLYRWPP